MEHVKGHQGKREKPSKNFQMNSYNGCDSMHVSLSGCMSVCKSFVWVYRTRFIYSNKSSSYRQRVGISSQLTDEGWRRCRVVNGTRWHLFFGLVWCRFGGWGGASCLCA